MILTNCVFISADVGWSSEGIFLWASILTVMEIWDFVLVTFILACKRFPSGGHIQLTPERERA